MKHKKNPSGFDKWVNDNYAEIGKAYRQHIRKHPDDSLFEFAEKMYADLPKANPSRKKKCATCNKRKAREDGFCSEKCFEKAVRIVKGALKKK